MSDLINQSVKTLDSNKTSNIFTESPAKEIVKTDDSQQTEKQLDKQDQQ
jgi:hypothetical protein